MKPTILNLDTSYTENPDGTYKGARNIVSVPNKDYKKNEDGIQIFERKGIVDTPTGNRNRHKYSQVRNINGTDCTLAQIGEIVVDNDRSIIFSLGYGNNLSIRIFDEIGILYKDGYYETVLNDLDDTIFTPVNKLFFDPYYPITGEFGYFKGELIIAYTDNSRSPKVVNIDHFLKNPPSISDPFLINTILMFPEASQVNTNIVTNNTGGLLESGSHYFVYQYKDSDGFTTNFSAIDNPFFIFKDSINDVSSNFLAEGSLPNVITSKSVSASLTNVDTRYKFLIVAVIKKIQNGKTITQKILEIPIYANTLTFTYTGNEIGTDIDINEVLVKRTSFDKIKKFTQIHNRLYAADTLSNKRIKFQKFANLINIDCTSKLISPLTDSSKKVVYNYNNKSHPHREVVAAYIHLVFNDGSISEGFHIPSFGTFTEAQINAQIAPSGQGYRDTSTLATTEGITAKVFQIEDTCEIITKNPTGESVIRCGLWENQDDLYPDNANGDFDSTVDYNGNPLGGVNLVGKKVRYHRMPSIAWMKNNIYDANANYSKTQLDLLGLKVTNVIIPDEIKVLVKSWVISFAKRDFGNSTVLGQSHLLFSNNGGTGTAFSSNGLNVDVKYKDSGILLGLIKTVCRFYDFSLIKTQAAISPVYLANELFYNATAEYRGGQPDHVNQASNRRTLEVDFIVGNITGISTCENPAGSGIDCRLRKVNNNFYIPSNIINGIFDNRKLEECLILELNRDMVINAFGLSPRFDNPAGGSWNLEFEVGKYESYLSSLMALPQNIYSSFFAQELILTGEYVDKNTTSHTLYKGDIYIVTNSINAMGLGVDVAHSADTGDFSGIRVAHNWICECALNSELRISNPADPRTKYQYKWSIPYTPNRLDDLGNSNCALPYDFNFDYNATNSFNSIFPFNPFLITETRNSFRISRGLPLTSETNINNWRLWLVNDYFESVRNKGELVNIQGRDRNLIIHHAQALFETVSNELLKVDSISVFIGSGDIFEILPQEIVPSNEGSYGTQNKLSCVLTPKGYVFIDSDQKKINLYIGNREVITLSDALIREFSIENIPYDITNIQNHLFPDLNSNSELPIRDNPYFLFGYNIVYDSKFERLIISKKAYELTELGESDLVVSFGIWGITSGLLFIPKDYSDTDYFINKSFTISYSFRDKGFTAFHDFTPNRIISTRNNILSFFNTIEAGFIRTRVYKHNYIGNKAIYYNTTIKDIDSTDPEAATPFNSYIVPCFALSKNYENKPSFEFINLNWITNVLNSNNAIISQETFTKLLAFNSYQSTDDFDLLVFTFAQYFESNIRNIKGTWYFNKLIDLLREDITTDPSPQQPFIIDNELNQSITPINLNKNFFNKRPLIDKFLAIKLLYDNKISSNLQNEIQIVDVDCEVLEVPR